MTDFYVGLMSGTSMDGIDAVLVSFDNDAVQMHASHSEHYPPAVRQALLNAIAVPLHTEPDPGGELDRRVGECFRDAALAVIARSGIDRNDVVAIGSHGQTLRHCPDADQPFSLQIGAADTIVAGTNITTVTNFRQADIDAGGQGAPLLPPFHERLLRTQQSDRVVVNIGGIANITVLPSCDGAVTGFDTGPGNGLMDAWIRQERNEAFDADGRWAAAGRVSMALLEQFLADPYFARHPPKSTGFEYFNLRWLQQHAVDRYDPCDVQTTLCELTAKTIANAVKEHADNTEEIFVCGGGVHNQELIRRLRRNLPDASVASTAVAGLDPDWIEAAAFAWLAMRTLCGKTGNLPTVTGAGHKVVLGDIHSP